MYICGEMASKNCGLVHEKNMFQLALLQKEHGALKENFQSLLETAKSEIARKDKEITRLSCGALHQRYCVLCAVELFVLCFFFD